MPLLDGPSLAVNLPGRADRPADLATLTVDDEVASVAADVEAAVEEPIVLVAHSSGGLVVPGVVEALGSTVERIVLSAALVPPEGGCGLDCMQKQHAEGLRNGVEKADREGRVITLPGAPEDPEAFRNAYGGDPLDDESLSYVVDPARCVPDTVRHYFQPVFWSRAAHVPVTYVVNERDRPIPPDLQEKMVSRIPSAPHVVRLPGGHIPAVTAPEVFAAVVAAGSDN